MHEPYAENSKEDQFNEFIVINIFLILAIRLWGSASLLLISRCSSRGIDAVRYPRKARTEASQSNPFKPARQINQLLIPQQCLTDTEVARSKDSANQEWELHPRKNPRGGRKALQRYRTSKSKSDAQWRTDSEDEIDGAPSWGRASECHRISKTTSLPQLSTARSPLHSSHRARSKKVFC